MKNLYKELEETLITNGKQITDIVWVGTKEFYVPTEDFLTKIKEVYYDNDVGLTEIAPDLIIVGDNWGLKRNVNLSGTERWEFIEFPTKPVTQRTDITNFSIRDYVDQDGFRVFNKATSLSDLNPEPISS